MARRSQGKGSLVLGPGLVGVQAEFDGIADGIACAGQGLLVDAEVSATDL